MSVGKGTEQSGDSGTSTVRPSHITMSNTNTSEGGASWMPMGHEGCLGPAGQGALKTRSCAASCGAWVPGPPWTSLGLPGAEAFPHVATEGKGWGVLSLKLNHPQASSLPLQGTLGPPRNICDTLPSAWAEKQEGGKSGQEGLRALVLESFTPHILTPPLENKNQDWKHWLRRQAQGSLPGGLSPRPLPVPTVPLTSASPSHF